MAVTELRLLPALGPSSDSSPCSSSCRRRRSSARPRAATRRRIAKVRRVFLVGKQHAKKQAPDSRVHLPDTADVDERGQLTMRSLALNVSEDLHSLQGMVVSSRLPATVRMSPKYVKFSVLQLGQVPCIDHMTTRSLDLTRASGWQPVRGGRYEWPEYHNISRALPLGLCAARRFLNQQAKIWQHFGIAP